MKKWIGIVQIPDEEPWAFVVNAPDDATRSQVFARVVWMFRDTAKIQIVMDGGTTITLD